MIENIRGPALRIGFVGRFALIKGAGGGENKRKKGNSC